MTVATPRIDRVVVLCEDDLHKRFLMRWLAHRNIQLVDAEVAPSSKGSGSAYVKNRFQLFVKKAKQKANQAGLGFIVVLDGDNVRHGLCADLGFSSKDRVENIRRIGEVTNLFMEAGVIVLTAFISPYRADRERVRDMVGQSDFIEIYCNASLEVCENRDIKGLYKKARAGQIAEFTGISAPYEAPLSASLTINTGSTNLDVCVEQVIKEIMNRKICRLEPDLIYETASKKHCQEKSS